MEYLFNKKIMFRNYHPSAIFLDQNGTCKVTDFSWANIMEENKRRFTVVDIPEYYSPE